MRQYLDAKQQHRDAILFFRMGDFYEMFYEDALVAARALELTLTSRSKDANGGGIPMCGVPFHAVDGYIARLVRKGFRVAICDQVEDPRKAKGIVKREVVRVVSPGTLTDASYLDAREPAFLMAVAPASRGNGERGVGVALLDVSTGEFTTAEYHGADGLQALADELAVIKPREIVTAAGEDPIPGRRRRPAFRSTPIDGWAFDLESARRTLLDQLRVGGLEGFGLDRQAGGRRRRWRARSLPEGDAEGRSRARPLAHLPPALRRAAHRSDDAQAPRDPGGLGRRTRRIAARGARPDSDRPSAAGRCAPGCCVRCCRSIASAIGSTRSKNSRSARPIAASSATRSRPSRTWSGWSRVIALGTAGPRDFVAPEAIDCRDSPRQDGAVRVPGAARLLPASPSSTSSTDVRQRIDQTLVDDPPALAREGGYIRDGVDAALDELRTISRSGKQIIAQMEERERARTGIASLKVRYNRVFGYYIEISKSNLHAVPPDYHRKQTIAGGERFITPALKEYEERVLGADERIVERELELFDALRAAVAAEAPRIQASARALAALDVLAALAEAAAVNNYTKPHVHDGDEIAVFDARHPVVERRTAAAGEAFVPNDILLNGDDLRSW